MLIQAIFENGNRQYVTGVVLSDDGKILDAKTSYYPKEIACDIEELRRKFPPVKFERKG